MVRAFLALFLFSLGPAQKPQQPPLPPLEKSTVEGSVVTAATGAPLKKAWLTLRKVDGGGQPHSASTDPSGRFALREIEPGRYRLWVARNGYVPQEYGQRAPNRPGTILTLQPGQQVKDVVFRLIPGAAITGHVYDEDGEPVAGVSIQALRHRYVEGKHQLAPAGIASTNDQGEYRMFGFSPGRYYLSATSMPGRFAWGAAFPTDVVDLSQSVPTEGHAPVYYPGVTDPTRATPIELSAGDEVRAVDFSLSPTRTVCLRGRVYNAIRGEPGRNAFLFLQARESGMRGLSPGNVTRVQDAQGTFEMRGVTPGSYFLVASWNDEGKSYSTREPIDVGTTDIEGLSLVLTPGIELKGRVRSEGNTELNLADLHVYLQPRDETLMGGAGASVKSDGTFVLQNVSDGLYRVALPGAPEDFFLKAGRSGGDEVLGAGLSVVRSQPPASLDLVLSPAGGRIDGMVLNGQKQAFSGARVVLVPDSDRRSQTHLYKTTTTDQNGGFTLRGIAPGGYKLFAWEEVETGAYQDPDFLRPYEDRGESLSVQEGGRYTAQLQLIPASEPQP